MIELAVNQQKVKAKEGQTILQAALDAGIYIPHLCHHPQLAQPTEVSSLKRVYQGGMPKDGEEGKPFEGCKLCLVKVEGMEGLIKSCEIKVEHGMHVTTDSESVKTARKINIKKILEQHPHACLLCAQADGCDRKICSLQIPEDERCCSKFGTCEIQKVAEFIGIEKGLPPYQPSYIPVVNDEPLIRRAYDLCIGCLRCVRICKEIRGADALGFTVRDGRVVVGSKMASLRDSGCQFCGFCVEVCPTGALLDKDVRAGKREKYLVPCRSECPGEVDVPRYVRLIAEKKFGEALDVIREKVPFPSVLGRACFHPCETVCRRGELDEPVAICALKRAASDFGEPKTISCDKEKTGKRVAVVGAGPAGLTGAYYLNRLGHDVTVFDMLTEAGGMLRVGIPGYRLSRSLLNKEIEYIKEAGIEIKTSHRVESVEDLFSQGFEAIFAAIGSHKGVRLGIPGEHLEKVADGIAFLRKVNIGAQESCGDRVAIIGGGNVAIDSARSALRLGAKEVTLFYRRTRDEMPAHDEEVKLALEEGVKFEYQVTPISISIGQGEDNLEVEFIRMEMGEPDESKRHRPLPVKGSEFTADFDLVISSIGQYSEEIKGLSVSSRKGDRSMELDEGKGVFIGGDFLTGPSTIIDAVAGGRKAAAMIDRFLGGEGDLDVLYEKGKNRDLLTEVRNVAMANGRESMPKLPIDKRCGGFSEVALGFDEETAVKEANRCLGCDLRLQIKESVMPPELHMELTEKNVAYAPEVEGVYVLYDKEQEIYKISGVENVRQALLEESEAGSPARYFDFEEDPMFTAKERQLTQQYMKKGGQMPPGNSELDDLF
jgi:formate dehydrogenase beta subunit